MTFGRRREEPPSSPPPPPPPSQGVENALYLMFADSYAQNGRLHAETVLGAVAALAGEFAMRATVPEVPTEGWIIGDEINGLLFEDSLNDAEVVTLWSIILRYARAAGATALDEPDWMEICRDNMLAITEQRSFPHLSVPQEHFPHEWSPEACPRFRPILFLLMEEHHLGLHEMALALAGVIGRLLLVCVPTLPISVALLLVAQIMKGVSCMTPLSTQQI